MIQKVIPKTPQPPEPLETVSALLKSLAVIWYLKGSNNETVEWSSVKNIELRLEKTIKIRQMSPIDAYNQALSDVQEGTL